MDSKQLHNLLLMSNVNKRTRLLYKRGTCSLIKFLYDKDSSMEVTAQVTFIKIDRPSHAFRYFGDNCWPRI